MIIDISRYNRLVDFAKAKAAGLTEVIARIGVGFNGDPFYAHNIQRARDNGLIVGSYYVPKWGYDRALQVEICAASLDGIGWKQNGEVWIDCEVADGYGKDELRARIHDFLIDLQKCIRYRPGIYTAQWWWNPNVGMTTWAKDYALWVANYTAGPKPLMPAGWTTWLLWQYSETGTLPGVSGRVDLNRRSIPF